MKIFTSTLTLIVLLTLTVTPFLIKAQSPESDAGRLTYLGETPPLTSIEPFSLPLQEEFERNEEMSVRSYPYAATAFPKGPDPVWQKQMGMTDQTEGLKQNFEGMTNTGFPPDPNGDVSSGYYFQTVNTIFQIWDKTGNSVYGPADIRNFWGATESVSDPVVLYDENADRWFVEIFTTSGSSYKIMMAVSTSSNPTGTYYSYQLTGVTNLPDFTKFGIWRDGYYMSANSGSYDVYAFDRDAMLAGETTDYVRFDNPWRPNSGFHCIMPVDNDGTFAPSGTPGQFITINDDAWGGNDELWIYELDVDWANPGAATFNRTQQLSVASFDSNFGPSWDNIYQQGTSQRLDGVPQVLNFRAQYRNFGTYKSIVCNHTVDVDNTDHAGVRWYELVKTGTTWVIHQQSTYAPDSHSRWMGAIAQNAYGDICLAYSISSTNMHPSLRFTGRHLGDALNTMTFAEQSIYESSYSQTWGNRWGDYFSMSVDPSDNRSFWFTGEYVTTTMHTRIAAINFGVYCAASGGCDEYISNVDFGTISNSSGCTNYGDFTDLSTDLPLNLTNTLTVTNGNPIYSGDQCRAWIDWNRDGDFADANEATSIISGVGPYNFSITPPPGTTTGACTMRIRITYTGTVDPCGTTTFGEVEDYTVNVVPEVPNVWNGSFNHYWHNANNWSAGHIPLSTEDVSIPNDGYQPVWVDLNDQECNHLEIGAGANLEIYDQSLTVNGNLTVDGGIEMMQDNAYINIMGNTVWNSGSSYNSSATSTFINAYGNWNLESGSDFTPEYGFVDFEGTTSIWIRCYSSTSNFYNLRIYKSGGAQARVSDLSTQDLVVNNLIYISTSGILNSYSSHNIVMKGAFNYYGTFDFTLAGNTGSAIFDGTSQTINNYSSGSGIFNNVVFSSSTGTTVAGGDINVAGDLTINQGYFSPGTNLVYVGGDWTNTVGDAGFSETGTHVVFNGGNYHQYCSNEIFGLLELNKASGGALRTNGTDVVCAAYDWTAGAIDVLTGSFTANDLPDNIVNGAFYVNPGGTINLINSGTGTYVDLQGELHNYGGTINITGSISYWPYLGDALVEMTGGVIDLTSCGLVLYNSYNLTTNITGGTIRMNGGFTGSRGDFTPAVGIIELYGSGDVFMSQANGCTVYDCIIDKSSKSANKDQSIAIVPDGERIDPTINNNSDVNTATLSSNFVVTGDLNINSGSLRIGGQQLDVTGDIDVSDNLIMDNTADVINGYQINWNSGSTEQITTGIINLDYRMLFNNGSNAQLGAGNTLNLVGTGTTAIRNYSPVAELGNLNVAMPPSSGTCFISYTTAYPVVVTGDLNVIADNYFHIQEYDVIVNGNMDIADGATVQLGSVAGSGYLEVSGNLTNNGNLLVDYDETASKASSGSEDESTGQAYLTANTEAQQKKGIDNTDWFAGEVYNHGHFQQTATGTTEILGGGTFICDQPTTSLVSVLGTFNLDDGIFEISHNHLSLNAVCSVNGGTIRNGGTFWASIAGNFQPTGGLVELIGTGSSGQYIQVDASNYFYDLTIDRTNAIMIYGGYNLNIKNDFTILSGGLNTNGMNMYVGGDWDNQVGLSAFNESTGKVVFNGPGSSLQYINSDEKFNLLENNTTQAIRINSAQDTVECNSYNWISGGVSVYQGTFIADDLNQSGVYGNWYALAGSEIYLYQDASQFVDMLGSTFYVNGGMMKVTGGQDESYWCIPNPLDLTIIGGGVLDFDGYGITIWSNAALTYNLSGGTLKTSGWLTCLRTDFNSTGTIEFYGGTDSRIDIATGSSFNNLRINKSGGDKSTYAFTDRDGKSQTGSKSNAAYLANYDLDVNGDLIVDAGTMDLNGYTMNVFGDANINNSGILLLEDNATFAMDNGSGLHVNNGGWLLTVATASNDALFSHISTGFYDLWIEDGGYISAEYTIFEYMAGSGVYLRPGSTVNAVYSFNNCTFRNGAPTGYLFTIYNDQSFQAEGTVFPTNTWGSAYNVYKNAASGDVYFPNATGGFAGEAFELDPYNLVHWDFPPRTLELKVFMEGAYDAGSGKMRTDINPMISTNQPFNPALPYFGNPMPDWYYTGGELVGSIPNAFVVDWVLVQLRDATSAATALPSTAIETFPAFVLNTGEIVSLDGLNPPVFSAAIVNNLYVAVWSRNHLGVMSANALVESGGIYSYDFSAGSGQAYGGLSAQIDLGGGTWGMISGDADGSGQIHATDKTNVWEIQAGASGYKASDVNLDGQVNNPDKDDYWLPNLGKGSFIPE